LEYEKITLDRTMKKDCTIRCCNLPGENR